MEQKSNMGDIQVCITQLKDYVAASPKKEGDTVNWEEINLRLNMAQRSLSHLEEIFFPNPPDDDDGEEASCLREIYPRT